LIFLSLEINLKFKISFSQWISSTCHTSDIYMGLIISFLVLKTLLVCLNLKNKTNFDASVGCILSLSSYQPKSKVGYEKLTSLNLM
jgi:hypothetical protein